MFANKAKLFWGACFTLFLLSACTPPRFPLKVTALSVMPDPVVGQTVTLRVEIVSTKDEPDTTIKIQLPEAVKLMDGDLIWRGSLKANQPQTHEVSVCVLYEGDWRISVTAYSRLSEDSTYGDTDSLHLVSTTTTGHAIPGSEYRYIQPPGGVPPSTPLPETPPPGVCP